MGTVPVTPAVVGWVVDESGFTLDEIAKATDATVADVRAWISGATQPTVTQARKLAQKVRRPLALLMWSSPPSNDGPPVAFRSPVGNDMRDLDPTERRLIRQAHRLQTVLAWVRTRLNYATVELPQASIAQDPEAAAHRLRALLNVPVPDQQDWSSDAIALREWRARIEDLGVLVFSLSLGEDACRGLTLADDVAPVVAINTAWNHRARIFTLFHELGHVVTKTTSACANSWAHRDQRSDPTERWCESFAAAALMPWDSVDALLRARGETGQITDLGVARAIANTFKVSLQAATLRLINAGRASWHLWEDIPRDANTKRKGGRPAEEPRTLPVIRLGEFGRAAAQWLVKGVENDLIERSQAASYLRVHDDALSDIERRVATGQLEVMDE